MKTTKMLAERCKNAGGCAPICIACIGDSVTHGCFEVGVDRSGALSICYEPDNAYPYRLKRRLERLYPAAAVNILNAGVSGEGAQAGQMRMRRDVLSRKPDLVVIAFGLNDSMCEDVEAGLRIYRQAMRRMAEDVAASGAECIVLTPNRMCAYASARLRDEQLIAIAERASRVQNEGILDRYVQAAREAAADLCVPVADAYAVWQAMQDNGVDTTELLSNAINHPGRAEHEIFVDALLRVLLTR